MLKITKKEGDSCDVEVSSSEPLELNRRSMKELCKKSGINFSQIRKVKMDGDITLDRAFERCKNLEEVVLGPKVDHIGDRSFSGCNNLKSVVMKSKTPKFGKYVFGEGMTGLDRNLSNIEIGKEESMQIDEFRETVPNQKSLTDAFVDEYHEFLVSDLPMYL